MTCNCSCRKSPHLNSGIPSFTETPFKSQTLNSVWFSILSQFSELSRESRWHVKCPACSRRYHLNPTSKWLFQVLSDVLVSSSLTITLWGRNDCYPHFTDGETEAGRPRFPPVHALNPGAVLLSQGQTTLTHLQWLWSGCSFRVWPAPWREITGIVSTASLWTCNFYSGFSTGVMHELVSSA